jgi:hypothetical protein
VAVLNLQEVESKYLLLITLKDFTGKKSTRQKSIPDFVLAYMQNLPGCQVFQGFGGLEKGVFYLCEYGFFHPLDLPEMVANTVEKGLFVGFGQDRSKNFMINSLPDFQADNSLIEYATDFLPQKFDYVPVAEIEKLQVNLRFVDLEPDLRAPAAVLFLEKEEILWLKEMLYKLPGALFAEIEWIGNRDYLFLFFNDSVAIPFFPFGQPFRQIAAHIFIPADKDMVPHLQPDQLAEIFAAANESYTFITDIWRRDLPQAAKVPLQQLLTITCDIDIEFKPDSDMDGFVWEDAGVAVATTPGAPAIEVSEKSGENPVIPIVEQFAQNGLKPHEYDNNIAFIKQSLNEYGILLRRQGDLVGAATCFSLAEENQAAADCYAEAARSLAGE